MLIDTTIYTFKLPENVSIYGGRFNFNVGGVTWYSEYAHKINDPSQMNVYIYKPGNSILLDLSYSRKNFGVEVKSKWIDNFSYK